MNIRLKYIILLVISLNTLLLHNCYAINPQRAYAAKPDAVGMPYKTYKIKVDKSTNLNSWVCLQKDLNKPYIIISGSDAGNMANSLGQAKAFYDEGYNVILYDYRGFGESSDFEINPNMLYYKEFSEDLKMTISFVQREFKPTSIILYGQSMGTIVSRMNMDNDILIKGLILDSFVINPKLLADRAGILKNKQILLPEGATEYTLSNTENLNKSILIFSGLQDQFTKTNDYKDFLLKNPNSKIVTADCNHLQCFTSMGTDPNLYIVEAEHFIGRLINH